MEINWNNGYTEVEGKLNKYNFTFDGKAYKIEDTQGGFGIVKSCREDIELEPFYGLHFMATDEKERDVHVYLRCATEFKNDDDDSHMEFLTKLDLDKDVYIINGYEDVEMSGSSFTVKKLFIKE